MSAKLIKTEDEQGVMYSLSGDNLPENYVLSKQNCDEIFWRLYDTEIIVEIEMENYGYCEGCRKAGILHCAHADTCGYAETRERPKLDSSGNLILKKI